MIAAAGLAGAGSAHADTAQPCSSPASVVIHLPNGVQTVSAATLCSESDVFNTQYSTRSIPGAGNTQQSPFVAQGTSIRALLQDLQPAVDLGTVTFVAIPRSDGTWTTLGPADLADPSDFAHGLLPVLQVTGSLINYIRPLRPSNDDVNGGDFVTSPSGGTIEVDVHTGPQLSVEARASRSTAHPDQRVTFAATVRNPPGASLPLTYAWTFGDGATGSGSTVRHAFSRTGTFDAQVTVTGSDDSGGTSDQVAVTIGAKPPKTGGGGHGTGTPHHPHGPSTGPNSGSGNRSGATPSHRPASGNADGGSRTGNGNGSGSLPTVHISLPPIPAAGPRPIAAGQQPQLAAQPPVVHGQLIGPGVPVSARDTAESAESTALAAQGSATTGIGLGAGAVLVVVGLLGLGAYRESRASGRRVRSSRAGP